MLRRLLAAAFVLALTAPAWADNKVDAKKLKGKWLREVEGTKLLYTFKDEKKMTATITPAGADAGVTVSCEYSIDKDGVLSGVIEKVEGGEGGPNPGDKFSFKIELGKETLVVSDLKGVEGDQIRMLVEGEYKKQTD